MKSAIFLYRNSHWKSHERNKLIHEDEAQLVLCFGAKSVFAAEDVPALLREKFPQSEFILCSTSGEIFHTEVLDDSLSVAAMQFDHTTTRTCHINISDFPDSYEAGKGLLKKFDQVNLTYVLVLSDGSQVNGSELVRGMNEVTQQKILVTGGLAGDGSNFQSTYIGINDKPQQGLVAAIGFYGNKLKVGHGSKGGWETFGLEKEVTRSVSNVLYEIDGKNALELYKEYLGPEAASLPGSALLFPLAVKLPGETEFVVRTILSISDEAGSMTFAGDTPVGSKVRLMKANFDKLTNAAAIAAVQTQGAVPAHPDLALLISCVGRKLILQSRTEEEVEAVDEVFNHETLLTGFYSYGEISPLVDGKSCQLHNQTMTITTFYEEK
jgi:hypothetical protein